MTDLMSLSSSLELGSSKVISRFLAVRDLGYRNMSFTLEYILLVSLGATDFLLGVLYRYSDSIKLYSKVLPSILLSIRLF